MLYKIRKMKRSELDLAVEWAAKEGWNPGLYDGNSFYETDRKGFLMGFLDTEPISSISAISYGDDYGFLGFYIVKPEYRNKGYGIQIWNAALKHMGNKNIGLDGVVAQQESYKKSGFNLAYRNIRYAGKASINNSYDSVETIPVSEIPFELLVMYDSKMFSTSRSKFLRLWIPQPQSLVIGILEEGNIKSYGMIRKCRVGYKVGPLFAENGRYADIIFSKLMKFAGVDEPVFLDVPEPNKEGIKLAKRYVMKPVFETARMYTKTQPEINLNKVFGVTSFELG